MTTWPRQSECDAFYGNPRNPKNPAAPSPEWMRANLVLVKNLPFVLRYAGHPVPALTCHRKVADAFRAVLEDIWRRAGKDQRVVDAWGMSTFAGSFNYRLMRGLNTLSMHSYGCAFDFDPARNALHDKSPHFAQCPEVLAAWKAAGAVWGGSWPSRPDGMHFQFAIV